MNMLKKILLMGPLSPPYTGQSVAFTTIVNQLPNDKIVINISKKDSILSGSALCLKIIFIVLFKKIDLIYFTCSRSFFGSLRDIILLICARMKKIKVINHLHGNAFYQFYHSTYIWYKPIVKYCYDWIDTSIVLLPSMKFQFKDFAHMKIVPIANCFSSDFDRLSLNREKREVPTQIIYLSNILESKGIINLLLACERLFEKNDFRLVIAGSPMRDYISSEMQIKAKFDNVYNSLKRKYPNKIDYLGVVSGKEKINLLWDSDVFILPTFYPSEAFPISILEALRAGNYIISTRHNLIPEIVTENNGILIEPDSVEAIINAIENILYDRDKLSFVQNNNIQYAINNYNEKMYVSKVLSLISL
jgi:glycosyltransferase involved in cell wall biosynthesis